MDEEFFSRVGASPGVGAMSDTSWRFYEVEKRAEELEVAVLKQRRFMIFLNACLWVSFIALLMVIV